MAVKLRKGAKTMNVCLLARWAEDLERSEIEDDIVIFQENERLEIVTERGTLRVSFDRFKIAMECLGEEKALEMEGRLDKESE